MRIAYVCTDPGVPVFGSKGASIHVQEMLRAFGASGADVTLLSPRIDGPPPADLAKVRRVTLPPLPKGDADTRARQAQAANDSLRHALAGLGPLELVYERHALHAHAAMEFARDRGIPSVLEVNAPLLEEQARHRTLALPREAGASARRAMSAASVTVAVSPAVATYAHQLGAASVHVIPNAVDPARFPPRPAPSGPFTVGFLGSLKPWHDVTTLIAALPLLRADGVPEARLLIVGDGPERSRLDAQADSLGLGTAVEFTGAVGPGDVPDVLARMHAAVAPYRAEAGFYFSPLKLYEYMAAGLPAVASAVGHLAEVVRDGRTGLLVEPENPADLAAALARLARDRDLCRALGSAARADVLAHHTWTRVAARVLTLAGLQSREAA